MTTVKTEWEHAYQHTRRNVRVRCERIEKFNIDRECLILDYGCGDGLDLLCFQKLGYKRVVGIDISTGLLHEALASTVLVADCHRTPFADGTFDVVYVNSVLHHLTFEMAVTEIRRILKPGGKFCLVEPRSGLPRRLLDLITCSTLGAVLPIPLIRHRRTAVQLEWPEYSAWLTRDSNLVADLRALGFEIVFHQKTLFSVLLACERR